MVTIYAQIQKFKDKDHIQDYPRNFLIYAAGLTKRVLFGTRQIVKRNRMKLVLALKPEKLQEELKILEEKLIISEDDKTPRKNNIKLMIQKELKEAKVAAVNKKAQEL
jgi:hypothetical protein